jgi:hypothetical protein
MATSSNSDSSTNNNGPVSLHNGSCNCRGVTYQVKGTMRDVTACHCGQCRKQTGLYFAATEAMDTQLTMHSPSTVKWYDSSTFAQRGFCGECGSSLFWKAKGSGKICILAGSLDGNVPIRITRHIFCQDKGTFYELTDGLPQFPQDDVPKESYFE